MQLSAKHVVLVLLMLTTTMFAASRGYGEEQPEHVVLTGSMHGGSGCPAQAPLPATLTDPQTVTFAAPKLQVGGPKPMQRSNCDVMLTLTMPIGWQVSPRQLSVTVTNQLTGAAKLELTGLTYQQGQKPTALATRADPKGAEVLTFSPTWSGCAGTATLVQGVALRLRNGPGAGGEATAPEFGPLLLSWRRCPK